MGTNMNQLKRIILLEEKVGNWFTRTFMRRRTSVQICAGDKPPKESEDKHLFFVSIGWLKEKAQDDPELMKILVESEL